MNGKSIQEMLAVSRFIREISGNPTERRTLEGLSGEHELRYESDRKLPNGTIDLLRMLKSSLVAELNAAYGRLLGSPKDETLLSSFQSQAKDANARIRSLYPKAYDMLKAYSGDTGNHSRPAVRGDTPEQFVVGIAVIFGVVVIIIGAVVNVAVGANAVSAANATFIVNVNVDAEP